MRRRTPSLNGILRCRGGTGVVVPVVDRCLSLRLLLVEAVVLVPEH